MLNISYKLAQESHVHFSRVSDHKELSPKTGCLSTASQSAQQKHLLLHCKYWPDQILLVSRHEPSEQQSGLQTS